jgi:hypothetical protein
MSDQTPDKWLEEQIKPLNMFELAKQWTDAIKVIGAGNGAGVLAAGAALNTFSQRHDLLVWIKTAGAAYFVGLLAFALSFYCVHAAVLAFDTMLHATRKKNASGIDISSQRTTILINRANYLAIVGALAFLVWKHLWNLYFASFVVGAIVT